MTIVEKLKETMIEIFMIVLFEFKKSLEVFKWIEKHLNFRVV